GATASDQVVRHAPEEQGQVHAQGFGQQRVGGEEKKNAGYGRRQEKDGRADHEPLMGFRTVAQKVGGGDERDKGKQSQELKGQESQRDGASGRSETTLRGSERHDPAE